MPDGNVSRVDAQVLYYVLMFGTSSLPNIYLFSKN
jgi:hypothetical protein